MYSQHGSQIVAFMLRYCLPYLACLFLGGEWVPDFDSPPPFPTVSWDTSQLPGDCGIIHVAHRSLSMHSGQLTVKPQGVTVSCP